MSPKVTYLLASVFAVVYAVVVRLMFGLHSLSSKLDVMTMSFLIFVPFCIGVITVAISNYESSRSVWFRLFAPWLPILIFLVISVLLTMEGLICWVMALPFFLVFASVAGLITGLVRDHRQPIIPKLSIVIIAIFPFLLSPIEQSIKIEPKHYDQRTSIEINSTDSKIWSNVVRVRTISESEDRGSLAKWMGFSRPVKAELDTLAVGGRRMAEFTGGLVFDEVVMEYQDKKRMHFSITPLTTQIPPTTLDEHITVGGKYFNILDGTYELEKVSEGKYNLILYSHFTMNTTFNFYSGLWANLIMKDIQENILQVIKSRSEGNTN